eukprot:2475521-Karenia_brevis.AAC.1
MPRWRSYVESQEGEPPFKQPPSKPKAPVVGAGAPATEEPKQPGAYNTPEEPTPMGSQEVPLATHVQLPKIGGLAKTGSTVVAPQGALGQRPKI